MTLHWFTDGDRQARRDHEELLQVYEELMQEYAPPRTMTDEDRTEAIKRHPMLMRMSTVKTDPYRRG